MFGSNRQGRHGKGAALEAVKHHGAICGESRGFQGRSYAIITKELRKGWPRVTLPFIEEQVDEMLQIAAENPQLTFNVTAVGCGLAGFSPEQIAPLFARRLPNVKLPPEFEVLLG